MQPLSREKGITTELTDAVSHLDTLWCKISQTNLDDDVVYSAAYVCNGISGLLSLLGVATNILNVIVYWKQGIRETVNISFIALSLWDLISCMLSNLAMLCFFIETFFPFPDVNMLSVQFVYVGYTRGLMYILSTLVTVYLSVERCICIVLPFKVKDTFTSARVILVNLSIAMFGLACLCPVWTTQGLHWLFDPVNNRTRLDLWVSSNRRDVDVFVDTVTGMVVPLLAQFIITVNAGFMIRGIKNSSKFRQQTIITRKPGMLSASRNESSPTTATHSVKQSKILSSKDVKLTLVVVLLAVIFFVCNLPVFIVSNLRALIPEIDTGKQYYKLYVLLYSVVFQCGVIYSTVNIVVYYTVSTRFKQEILSLLNRASSRRSII